MKNLEKLFPETAIKIENSVNNNIGESLKIGEYLGDDYNYIPLLPAILERRAHTARGRDEARRAQRKRGGLIR